MHSRPGTAQGGVGTGQRCGPGRRAETPLLRPAPGARVRPERVTHRASSSRKITLLQQPANTRPTAKAGRMAGAGAGERARRRRPPTLLPQEGGNGHARGPGARLLPGAEAVPSSPEAATHAASRGAVVLSQPRPHSSEGASKSRPDYISQHPARPYAGRDGSFRQRGAKGKCHESLARSAAAGPAGK